MEEQRRAADDAAALAKAKPKGPPAHLVSTEARPRFGGLAAGSQAAPEATSAGPVGGRTRGDHRGAWFRNFADIVTYTWKVGGGYIRIANVVIVYRRLPSRWAT